MEMALELCCPHKDQSLHLAPTEMSGGGGCPGLLADEVSSISELSV